MPISQSSFARPIKENATNGRTEKSNFLMVRYGRSATIAVLAACLGLLLALHAGPATNEPTETGRENEDSGPRWSPDHKTLVRVETEQLFATPDGANSCLYFNAQAVYPARHCTPRPKSTYRHIHTFVSPPEWSPDSRKVALVEKIFDWEYYDPFGRYLDGESSDVHYYLVIAGIDGAVLGYPLKGIGQQPQLQWQSNSLITLNGQSYDLAAHPPLSIP